MFQQPGQQEFVRLQFRIEGSLTLPSADEAVQVLQAFQKMDYAAVRGLADRSFSFQEGEPVATGKATSVDK